jgi:hypothetical protein
MLYLIALAVSLTACSTPIWIIWLIIYLESKDMERFQTPRTPRYRLTPEEKRAYRLRQRNLRRLELERQWHDFTDIFLSKSAGYVLLRLSIIWIAICGIIGYLNS